MFVEMFSNNGIPYLRLVESERYTNSKGIRTVRKKCIFNIGPLKRFDDGLPDFVPRLKKSFKDGSPMIPELQPFCSSQPLKEKYLLELSEGDPFCVGHPKLFSHCLIERILEELFSFSTAINNLPLISLILPVSFVYSFMVEF